MMILRFNMFNRPRFGSFSSRAHWYNKSTLCVVMITFSISADSYRDFTIFNAVRVFPVPVAIQRMPWRPAGIGASDLCSSLSPRNNETASDWCTHRGSSLFDSSSYPNAKSSSKFGHSTVFFGCIGFTMRLKCSGNPEILKIPTFRLWLIPLQFQIFSNKLRFPNTVFSVQPPSQKEIQKMNLRFFSRLVLIRWSNR